MISTIRDIKEANSMNKKTKTPKLVKYMWVLVCENAHALYVRSRSLSPPKGEVGTEFGPCPFCDGPLTVKALEK